MKFVYNGYVYDDEFVEKLNEKCKKVQAHGFKNYLHDAVYGGKSAINRLKEIRTECEDFLPIEQEKQLNLSQEKLLEIVKDFYRTLSPSLSQKVDSILNKENPNPDYKVEIIEDKNDKRFGRSFAEHSNRNSYIYIQISLDGTVEGLRVAAHELSHAMSSQHTKKTDLIKQNDENKFIDFINSLGKYDRDCIGEIESHIIEYLFMEYLVNRGIISNDDFKNFESIRHNTLLNNLDLIREEYDILSHVGCPITAKSFERFVKRLQSPFSKKERFKYVMNRSRFMAERNKEDNTHNAYSQYRFRYVIGEIVSTLWYDQYCQANKTEKQEMIKKLEDYLSKTDSITLSSACPELVGLGIGDTFKDYIYYLQSKSFKDCL